MSAASGRYSWKPLLVVRHKYVLEVKTQGSDPLSYLRLNIFKIPAILEPWIFLARYLDFEAMYLPEEFDGHHPSVVYAHIGLLRSPVAY